MTGGPGIGRRAFLAGTAAALAPGLPAAPGAAQEAAPAAIAYGWDPGVAGPAEADLYVAPDGDDDADGSLQRPLRTVAGGVAALARRGRGSLALRGGLYREEVSLDALRGSPEARFRIHRYGTERVTISAAETLTGWRPCTPGETEALGLPPGVFTARLDPARLAHGAIYALNLHEAGRFCPLALDRADGAGERPASDPDSYHPAEFLLGPGDRIGAIRDRRLIGLDPGRLADVRLRVYHYPNLVGLAEIAGFDPATGTLRLAGPDLVVQRSGDAPRMLYALENLPQALAPGQWAVRRQPDGLQVFLLPRDRANLTGGIEVSLRGTCIDFAGAEFVELFGIEAVRAAGEGTRGGICLRRSGGYQSRGRGLSLVHCRAGETTSSAGRGYSPIHLHGVEELRMRHVTVEEARNSFGLFVSDSRDVDLRFLHVARVSNSAGRFFGVRQMVLAFSLFEDSGGDAHANKFNFYQGSDQVLVYGVRTRRTRGYATYQKASRIHFAFCELDCDPQAQNRALVSQNAPAGSGRGGADDSGDPVAGSWFWYWNNSLHADPRQAEPASSLSLGPGGSSQYHAFHNNVLHGGGLAPVYLDRMPPEREARSHNRYTGLAFWQSPRYGWRLAEAEEQMRIGARPRGAGRDMRPEIVHEIAPLFPGFTDWDRDIDGRPVDWSAPPIGCSA